MRSARAQLHHRTTRIALASLVGWALVAGARPASARSPSTDEGEADCSLQSPSPRRIAFRTPTCALDDERSHVPRAPATGVVDAIDRAVMASPRYAQNDAPPPAPPPAPASTAKETLEERLSRVERELEALKAARAAPPPPEPPHPASSSTGAIASASEGTTRPATKAALTIGGYVEAFYQWNFNEPSNGLTNYRGFDNRHNTFTLDNVVLDAAGSVGPVSARLALQVGHTPESYYLAEPFSPGTSAVGPSSGNVWKFIQQAIVAWTAPWGRGLTIDAGIFLSPVGPEGIAIKDQWNWSRSDLFFGLPAYHTGARITYPFTDRLIVSVQVYNGWSSVVDNNPEKSIAAQVTYNIPDTLTYQFLYFTGVERPVGAPEGRAWRHLFDTYLALYPRPWLAALVHVDGGVEPNNFGTSGWLASALYLRFHPLKWMYLAARGDFFYEWTASNGAGSATPIFWGGANWISSATATLDVRPWDNVSFRLEYRHDQAQAPLFFAGDVQVDANDRFVPNARSQDTITLGATAWF